LYEVAKVVEELSSVAWSGVAKASVDEDLPCPTPWLFRWLYDLLGAALATAALLGAGRSYVDAPTDLGEVNV
jgi:hypothetical protein